MKTSLFALLLILGSPVFACDTNECPATNEPAKTTDTTSPKQKIPAPPEKKAPQSAPAATKPERHTPPAHLFM